MCIRDRATTDDVAVVERPFEAEPEEDEEHDRDPQLVAGGGTGVSGGTDGRGGGRTRRRSRVAELLESGRGLGLGSDRRLADVEEVDGEPDRGIRIDWRGDGAAARWPSRAAWPRRR